MNDIQLDEDSKLSLRTILMLIMMIISGVSVFLYDENSSKKFNQSISDLDITTSGENTIITNASKSIDEYTAKENLYILAGNLQKLTSFHSSVKGEVSALGGFYKQTVNNEKYKQQNEYYLQTKSTSLFVKVGKQVFACGEQVVMRDATNVQNEIWSNDFLVYSTDEYTTTYGVDPRAMTNYKLNDNTILEASLKSKSDNIYTFKYSIDIDKGTTGYRINMVKFGGLSSLPEFISCELEVVVDDKWQPLQIKCTDKYRVDLLGGLECTSTLVETFDSINTPNVTIPNRDLFFSQIA